MPVHAPIKSRVNKQIDVFLARNCYLPGAMLAVQLLSQAPFFVWLLQQLLLLPAFEHLQLPLLLLVALPFQLDNELDQQRGLVIKQSSGQITFIIAHKYDA